MNNNQRQFDFLDIINILSFYIGWRNLIENEEQSAQNDVHKANQEQAETLLREINRRFEEQNRILDRILELLEK